VGTVEDGNEVSCILEMMLSRWVYASTIYNNLLQDYHQLDSHQTFQGLQDSVNLFVRSLEDILVRLTRFEYCQKEIWVRAAHPGKTPLPLPALPRALASLPGSLHPALRGHVLQRADLQELHPAHGRDQEPGAQPGDHQAG
jgi:hypothetical protein